MHTETLKVYRDQIRRSKRAATAKRAAAKKLPKTVRVAGSKLTVDSRHLLPLVTW